MTVIAGVLIYVCMGMLTTVLVALIQEVVGEPIGPRDAVTHFVFWPITLCILFAGALEGSK